MTPDIDPSPPRRRRWLLPAAVAAAVVLVAATVAITLTLTARSTKPQPAAKLAGPTAAATPAGVAANASATAGTSSAEPRTYDAAKAAVDKIEAAAKTHDGGAGWDLMTAAGQATMPRDDYIKVVQGCPKLLESNSVLSLALDAGGSSATVKVSAPPAQGGQPYEWRLIYEAGHWKRQPSAGAMNWMGLGSGKALTVLRDGGYC